jgi:hypothetical protein
MPAWLVWLLSLGALLALGAIACGRHLGKIQRKTTLLVLTGAISILEGKVAVLACLLRARVVARGLAPIRARNLKGTALLDERLTCDAAALQSARRLGADYMLVVSLHDLSCRIDESRLGDLAKLRVNTALCVAYQILEVASGEVLAGQTLALCRTTSPIVGGTSVGSDVLDRLLAEVADRIDEQMESLRLAA